MPCLAARMSNHRNWIAAVAVTILASVGGCSAADEVTYSTSCGEVCARYSSCEADYDVEGCTDRCESSGDLSEDKQRRLQTCFDCIETRSCSDVTLSCSDCVGIVP